ncbi:MAG: SUMF1/EgtB/PvdO family nonheme iron enzyme [Myxococcota bacterium]
MDPSDTDTLMLLPPSPPATLDPPEVWSDRYQDLGIIAIGGMGEVRRALDRLLGRQVVLKVLRPEYASNPDLARLFVHEARLTAGLQHPQVVTVHDLGQWVDGRPFFVMKEVHGQTLYSVNRAIHEASRRGAWGPTPNGWTFRRVIDVFHQVALTVAYAHDRGVIHGDMKPENVMVGPYGEVQVMDWGLASSSRDRMSIGVAGTPAYMAPEQARGGARSVATDVYALGATLYELLSGMPPFVERDAVEVLSLLRAGIAPPSLPRVQDGPTFAETRDHSLSELSEPTTPPIPRALAEVVRRAMAADPAERYGGARALAEDVAAYTEGTRRTEEASARVAEALRRVPEITKLRDRAAALRNRADERLGALPRASPDAKKRKAWALQDEAAALEREAELQEIDLDGTLRAVLSIVPGLPAAHAALAEQLRARHAAREGAGDAHDTSRLEIQLRAHVNALPKDHPARPPLVGYLAGHGTVDLHSTRRCEVVAHRYEIVNRRLIPVSTIPLGRTPLTRVALPMGSYLMILKAERGPEVRYPVQIDRNGHWSDCPPGVSEPHRVELPTVIPPGAVYVPAGYAKVGGVGELPARWVWVDGFYADQFPVTNAQYLAFLNHQVDNGHADEAARHVPRERTGTDEPLPMYGRDRSGRYHLKTDVDGDTWQPDWPVVLVDWHDASAYARWRAAREGLPWRLLSEWEREKAGRGVDGRTWPWGEQEEDTWSATIGSSSGRSMLAPVTDYPVDVSPYGLRGCVGNVFDWCLEARFDPVPGAGGRVILPPPRAPNPDEPLYRTVRGGAWHTMLRSARCGLRGFTQDFSRLPYLGFRLGCDLGSRLTTARP